MGNDTYNCGAQVGRNGGKVYDNGSTDRRTVPHSAIGFSLQERVFGDVLDERIAMGCHGDMQGYETIAKRQKLDTQEILYRYQRMQKQTCETVFGTHDSTHTPWAMRKVFPLLCDAYTPAACDISTYLCCQRASETRQSVPDLLPSIWTLAKGSILTSNICDDTIMRW